MTTQLDLLQRTWIEDSIPIVERAIRGLESFNGDLLHSILPAPPELNWYGILLCRMKRRGLIERIGYIQSTRPERNKGVIAQWRARNGH